MKPEEQEVLERVTGRPLMPLNESLALKFRVLMDAPYVREGSILTSTNTLDALAVQMARTAIEECKDYIGSGNWNEEFWG